MRHKRLEPIKERLSDSGELTKSHNFDAKELAKQCTVEVTINRSKQWQFRMRISYLLMQLAAWVGWYSIELKDEGK